MIEIGEPPFIETPTIGGLENMMVDDIIDSSNACWNVELLNQFLCPRDVHAIMKIPIIASSHGDERLWRFTSNGEYTVRSAYQLIMHEFIDYNGLSMEGDWSLIWKLEISPRVKLFL